MAGIYGCSSSSSWKMGFQRGFDPCRFEARKQGALLAARLVWTSQLSSLVLDLQSTCCQSDPWLCSLGNINLGTFFTRDKQLFQGSQVVTYEARIIINLEDIWNDGHGDDRISPRAMVILLIRCRRYLHLVVSENGHPPNSKGCDDVSHWKGNTSIFIYTHKWHIFVKGSLKV